MGHKMPAKESKITLVVGRPTLGKTFQGILTLTNKELIFKAEKKVTFAFFKSKEEFKFPLNKIRSANTIKHWGADRLEIIVQEDRENTKSYYFMVPNLGLFTTGIASTISTNPLLKEWAEVINKARIKN